ncbi:hypothetical protein CEE36_00850 [candidate division TA06 bacterium B3_TA06]|uniref:Dipeptidylpeptidase IV N-terminal domain-containing protein n=1 Tax=candidate division TA06 bacterium B3_TA06 TaxID=2012487 RepID=A0A532VAT6_UNCT6|nr:MAG: hypothetical protein CEE36_00850 [candidate division TA06 bacterium B3_TA06]
MRKIVLILLAGVLMLSAVEWEIEQVTDDLDRYNYEPSIILDGENPLILFEQFDDADYDFLKLAYKDNGSWVTEEVLDFDAALYNFAMDSEGNLYIAFTDRVGEYEENDLFLATDTSGEMVVHRLTEQAVNYRFPVIRLDENDNVHIAYSEGEVGEFHEDWIHYGYFEEGEFRSEVVAEHMIGTYNFDFVLSSDGIPHVFYGFYTDSDGKGLMHSFRSVSAEWREEIILQHPRVVPYNPSAAIDEHGKFHVSWDLNSSYILYATDKSGS